MPRRYRPSKRDVDPDIRYDSPLVTTIIHKIMRDGKKNLARKIMYGAMERIRERTNKDPLEVLDQAIDNVSPRLEIKARRVGGSTYQIPVEVTPERRLSLAVRWILAAARSRPERSMVERLSGEILDASQNGGAAVRRKEETHRMAEANRAFAHFRW